MMRTLAISAVAVWLAVVPAAAAAAPGAFVCSAPAGWGVRRLSDGIIYSGAVDESGLLAVIAVRYYGPDDKFYADVDAYMRKMTAKPDVQLPGWKIGTVVKTSVAGRAAKRVVNDETEFVEHRSLNKKEVAMREEQVAVPASRGFYTLIFRVPSASYAAQRPIFARVLASFKPKL